MADTFFGFETSFPKVPYKESDQVAPQDEEDIDLLNDETFGCNADFDADQWEKQHDTFSQIFQQEGKISRGDIGLTDDLLGDKFGRLGSVSDEEEEKIIGNTISQLGLDDDKDYEVRKDRSQSLEFKEIKESWTSPARDKDPLSNSLTELISPGDGIWASPKNSEIRSNKPLFNRDLLGEKDSPQIHYANSAYPRRPVNNKQNNHLLDQLFPEPNKEMVPPIAVGSSPLQMGPGPMTRTGAIRAEDLEREFKNKKNDKGDTGKSSTNVIEKLIGIQKSPKMSTAPLPSTPLPPTPTNPMQRLNMPNVSTPPPGLHFPFSPGVDPGIVSNLLQAASPSVGGVPPLSSTDLNLATMMLLNQQIMQMRTGGNPSALSSPLAASLFSPQYIAQHPFLADPATHPDFQGGTPRGRGRGRWHNNRGRGNWNKWSSHDRHWSRDYNNSPHTEKEGLGQMPPSQMMLSKEKEWISKIAMMSLLSGDVYISDYYFITYMNNELLREANKKPDIKDVEESNTEKSPSQKLDDDMENTKKLIDYAQKHQKEKESYKPVKFEGSLGKLSITSVHHPRQIVDFSTPESDAKTQSRTPQAGKRRFLIYNLIEKGFALFLSLGDLERQLLEVTEVERVNLLSERAERINRLFNMFKIKIHHTDNDSSNDLDLFSQIMSVTKARKLLVRTFLLFNQGQSESLLYSMLLVFPTILKRDVNDQILTDLVPKIKILLEKSDHGFITKSLKVLRKTNLNVVLQHTISSQLLIFLLKSIKNDSNQGLDWSYYEVEIPNVLASMSRTSLVNVKPAVHELNKIFPASSNLVAFEE